MKRKNQVFHIFLYKSFFCKRIVSYVASAENNELRRALSCRTSRRLIVHSHEYECCNLELGKPCNFRRSSGGSASRCSPCLVALRANHESRGSQERGTCISCYRFRRREKNKKSCGSFLKMQYIL